MSDPRHLLGKSAEDAVASWLERFGWRVLARRRRSRDGGEVDLIACDPDSVLVGIEVRARRRSRHGRAAETVDAERCRRIARTLSTYAAEAGGRTTGLRIDLVTVEPDDAHGAASWKLARIPDVGRDRGVSRRRGGRGP